MIPVSPAMPAMHSLGTKQVLNKCLWKWIDTFMTGSYESDECRAYNKKGNNERTITPTPKFNLNIEIHMLL